MSYRTSIIHALAQYFAIDEVHGRVMVYSRYTGQFILAITDRELERGLHYTTVQQLVPHRNKPLIK